MKPESKKRARELRRDLTPSEKILWSILRDRRLSGFKFRRQQSIGPYFADFFCATAGIIVELDGESHLGQEGYDKNRSEWLKQRGYTVIRVLEQSSLQRT